MSISRRKTLAVLGGGFICAAGGGAYAVTRMPRTAVAPWAQVNAYEDARMRALSYAILAPNPHNRQPWIVDLGTPGQVTLFADTGRLLPHTDPFSRQIVIGLGCFLEMMALAAAADGYKVTFDLFPEGEDGQALDGRPVAVARFEPGAGLGEPDLFDHVLERRSLKEPYDVTRPVDDATLAALRAAVARGTQVATSNLPEDVADLRMLTVEALEVELITPATYKESVDLFRIGRHEVDASPDGIDFSGPMWEALHLTSLFTRESAMDPEGFAFKSGLDMVNAAASSGMAYIWQVTSTNTRVDQIRAGRDWLRINLAATAQGLGVQPMSQALQEYPEMAALYAQVHERLAPGGGTVQMLGRLGYGPQVPQSPRWPLDAKIRGQETTTKA